jgi:solute:Na+ symporter, SSS family
MPGKNHPDLWSRWFFCFIGDVMTLKISVLIVYFVLILCIGFIARTKLKSSPETYFLADRKLGTLVLLGTMVATNFSAFTVFGTSGAGYRDGYAFFPIMGFGTGFMALTFWILGRKIWQVGRDHGVVTPPELIRVLYNSPQLSWIFAVVMIIFTIPYLALQPMAAGYALEALIGLPYFYGCLLVTVIIVLYTLRGGLRAVAWTDLFQGLVMFLLLFTALVIVAGHHGGFFEAHQKLFDANPQLFSRPGGTGKYTYGIWFSYIMLWFFCDPMFPQLFQRFFTARNPNTLAKIMLFYPLICTLVFFLPISVGVMGHLSFPDLVGKEADRILPMTLTLISGDFMAALVLAAGLAALMSTMDSQLLTLSSLFTRDILPLISKKNIQTSMSGRIFVIFLSITGLLLAMKPPATILQIATQTFTGLAVLFPTVLFGLYCRRVFTTAALLSILVGEGIMLLFYFKIVPAGDVLPVVWVMLATFVTYIIVHHLLSQRDKDRVSLRPVWLNNRYLYVFTGIFFLGMDFWAWDISAPAFLGLPLWIFYFMLLSVLQTFTMIWLVRSTPKVYEA